MIKITGLVLPVAGMQPQAQTPTADPLIRFWSNIFFRLVFDAFSLSFNTDDFHLCQHHFQAACTSQFRLNT